MVIDIKMCKFESVPWGFRLVGGSDYEYPLTVVKVTPESIAEKAGMQVGDIIVRINDIAASSLTHNEAHDVILNCGGTFFFGVKRENEEPAKPTFSKQEHIDSDEYEQEIQVTLPSPEIRQNPEDNTVSLSVKVKSPPLQKQNAIDEEDNLEKEIAEILSDEKEMLKEHNVLGVNFYRIFPKPGVCMSSKVLRHLNEDATKTREEILKEQRKWTTFLQKPDRPIPKSKEELEIERLRQENPYKVVIKKQPKIAPDRVPTPPWKESTPKSEISEPEPETPPEEEIPIADTEVPDLTPEIPNENQNDATFISYDELEQNQTEESTAIEQNVEEVNEEQSEEEIPQKTEEELQLERQLAEVQQQLLALSNLPTTIQATLDAVTKQLAELIPAVKKASPVDINQVPDKIEKFHLEDQIKKDLKPIEEELEEIQDESKACYENQIIQEEEEEENQTEQIEDNHIEETSSSSEIIDYKNIKEHEQNEAELENIKWDTEQKQAKKEEQLFKKKKENGLIEELQQRLNSMDHIEGGGLKKKSRSKLFGPLVPSTRPLILPGGRRWRTPKDAFNEEFIAGVLSSQAELIAGSAIELWNRLFNGEEISRKSFRELNCASLAIQIEKKVNFMKYQKPEKKVDLDKSEVFKVLHNLDKRPKHGIEVRPPVVPAEEDIRNVAASCG